VSLIIRKATPEDRPICGEICYHAFHRIATEHNFPPDVPSPDASIRLLSTMFSHPGIYCVVAEQDGRIVGTLCCPPINPSGPYGLNVSETVSISAVFTPTPEPRWIAAIPTLLLLLPFVWRATLRRRFC